MKNDNISLPVDKISHISEECVSIYFEKSLSFSYQAGDCFTLSFPNAAYLGGKIFSFASSPTEKELFITYKKGRSDFKKKLEQLRMGDKMKMTYYGSQFTFHPELKAVFIAGGIGITPFRSMIKEVIDKKKTALITLIYLSRSADFAFRQELDIWSEQLASLDIYYIHTKEKGRLRRDMLLQLLPTIAQKDYRSYIAGPPSMIDATVELLIDCGVEYKNINTDSFDGYNEDQGLV